MVSEDLAADPFSERASRLRTERLQVLGGAFRFESDSPRLLRIARRAYAGLPRHQLKTPAPQFRIRLVLRSASSRSRGAEPPPVQMLSGAGLLYGVRDLSECVLLSPNERAALVVVSPDTPEYHVRYELIEFAVCTLAARAQTLVPLHAACIGSGGRGLLIIGGSGSGKSTLSLHAALEGLEFLSEDSVFVDPESLRATGVANFLHVRADSLRFVARARDAARIRNSPMIRRRSGVKKFELDLRRGGFRPARAPFEIAGVVVLSGEHADGALLRSISRARLASELRASQPYALRQPGWKTFSARVCARPAFELRRGQHPRESVAALRVLLKRLDRAG